LSATFSPQISKLVTVQILVFVLDTCLRLLHPFTPFVTEELWGHLKRAVGQARIPYRLSPEALIIAPWPTPRPEEEQEQELVAQFSLVQDVIRAIRNLQAEKNVKPGRRISAQIVAGERTTLLRTQAGVIAALAQLDEKSLTILETTAHRREGQAVLVVSGVEIYLPLAGLVDVEEEKTRLRKELAEAEHQAQRLEELLAGPFTQKAPAAVVQKERDKLAVITETVQKLSAQLESLS
jgi:valyl-tRNA synthetase